MPQIQLLVVVTAIGMTFKHWGDTRRLYLMSEAYFQPDSTDIQAAKLMMLKRIVGSPLQW